MPQPLRRKNVPIDWSIQAVSNHPVLTSGVGACVTAFASTEAAMGVLLSVIHWETATEAVDAWAARRTVREKLALLMTATDLRDAGVRKLTAFALDGFTSLAKRRSKLAHGFFGIVLDRKDEFAWRKGGSTARRMADGLATSFIGTVAVPPTWVYRPADFASLAQSCADTFERIEVVLKALPIYHGITGPLPVSG